MPLDILLYFL